MTTSQLVIFKLNKQQGTSKHLTHKAQGARTQLPSSSKHSPECVLVLLCWPYKQLLFKHLPSQLQPVQCQSRPCIWPAGAAAAAAAAAAAF
jgi:hypothetical protein